jgi:predicted RNase H-like nuclease
VLRLDDGSHLELGPPALATFPQARETILVWQDRHTPSATIVMLDQPTIVVNAAGQRPVENIVGSPVSLRYGGVQPANTSPSKADMFGPDAPVWPFLARFGGPADPLAPVAGTSVFETYPVLAMIALNWTLADARPTGRLAKYNPERTTSFSLSDWRHVCAMASAEFRTRGLAENAAWIDGAAQIARPRKRDQDCVDACVCLLVAVHFAERRPCLMVGDRQTGYMIVPCNAALCGELEARCIATGRSPAQWVRVFEMT